jgi:hypothetical protein
MQHEKIPLSKGQGDIYRSKILPKILKKVRKYL